MKRTIFSLIFIFISFPSYSVTRCIIDGKVVYSQSPCPSEQGKEIKIYPTKKSDEPSPVNETIPKDLAPVSTNGVLKALSPVEYLWVVNDKNVATVSLTENNNWKVKRIDGFYIGLITKNGRVEMRGDGLTVGDTSTLLKIHEAILSR